MSTGTEEGMGHGQLTLADSAGVPAGTLGTPAFVWLSEQGVEVRFASGLGEPGGDTAEVSGRVLVGPGEGKSSLQIASAGAAVGVAWQEVSADGHGVIKLRGVSQDSGLLGSEITLGGTAGTLSHHSLSISGYDPNAGATGSTAGGLNLVWVASDATDPPGVGRIMMQRFGVFYDDGGTPTGLFPVDVVGPAFHKISHAAELETGFAGAANDNSVWIGDDDGSGGAVGRLPTVATLDTGDVLVAWIGSEGHVHGKLYATAPTAGAAAPDYAAVNEALADLTPHYGRAGDGPAWDARRVKVGDLGPGNFALVWLVAAGADAMLNGSVFSLHADETLAAGTSADWVQTPMAPVALPAGFTGEFNLNVAEGHASDLVLNYEVADSAGNVTIAAVAQKISPADTTLAGNDVAPDLSAPDKVDPGTAASKVAFHGSSANPFLVGEQHDSIVVNTNSLAAAEPTAAAHGATATDTAADTVSDVIVSSNADGIAVARLGVGATDAEMSFSVTLGTPDATGAIAESPVIEITDSADPNVTPAVARIGGGGLAAAWVDAPSGELRAQTYNAHGQPEGSAGGLTVASGQEISDLALASNRAGHPAAAADGEAEPQAAAPDHTPVYDIEFALAWVLGANADGYGSIMLQRYWVTSNSEGAGAGNALVALGRDGEIGGDNDDATQFAVDDDSGVAVPVYGRAPQLTGLAQGQLAIGWVENDGAQETVKGAVIERDGGRAVLNIDLSEQLDVPAVVAKGTHPIITSAANGDILVGWLEPDGSGGFDIKAAIYKVAGDDAWSVPDKVLELQHFTSQPKDFSLGLTDDSEPSILLTWEGDGNAGSQGQRFDLDGDQLGNSFGIRDGHPDEVSDTTSLPDGRIVVVYTEQDKNGNVDVESHVVVTGGDSQSGSTASDGSDHIFGDRGALDTHAGLGDYGSLSDASPPVNDKDITVVEDATDGVIIDVLNEQIDTGLRVVQVNGADLAIGAPLRVEHGFVQLRDDGDLLFTADEHFHGTINFEYTVSNEDDQLATASVAVNVTPVEDDPMPVDLAFDQASEHTSLADASAVAYNGHDGGPDPGPGRGDADGSWHESKSGDERDHAGAEGNRHAAAHDREGHGEEDEAEHQGAQGPDQQPSAGGAAEEHGHGRHDALAADAAHATDGPGSQAPLAAMEDAGDTIAFAARYEHGYRPGSVERQWLQLDLDANRGAGDAAGSDAGHGQDGDHGGPRHDNDTFVFHAAFGNDAAVPEARGVEHVIDLSHSGYPTFQALQDSGALMQVGEDVEITLNVTDPSHPEKVLLRSVNLSSLTSSDFKFG